MKLFFVSSNAGKAEEVERILKGVEVEWVNADVKEESTIDLKRAAESKAGYALKLCKGPVLVEDTGIFFDAYPGFPGVNTHFIAETIGMRGCLGLLAGKRVGAGFRTVACYHDGEPHFFEGVCRGRIVEPKGEARKGMDYDAVFVPDGSDKTFAEMTIQEKQAYSHRRKAFEKVRDWLNA